MPPTSKLSRSSRNSSSHKFVYGHPTEHEVIKSKTSHRFVRIRHKPKSIPTKTHPLNQATRISTSQVAEPLDRKHKLLEKNGHFNGEITTVPNPIPDTGFRPPPTSISLGPSVHVIPLNKTGFPSPTSTATPLGPVTFHQGPPPVTIISSNPSYEDSNSSATMSSAAEAHSRKLPVPLIVLFAVGSGIILIGIFMLFRCYSRPSHRPRPKPSLPILDDPFSDDKGFSTDDSPIFGGNERTSNGGIWSWSQYPQPEIIVTKPDDIVKANPTLRDNNGYGATAHSPRVLQGNNTHNGHRQSQSLPVTAHRGSQHQTSLQQVQGALSRAANRISVASASLYPSSPRKSLNGIGLAISHSPVTAYTADGSKVLTRANPKAALNRSRFTMEIEVEAEKDLNIRNTLYSEGSSYAISDVGSPSFLPYASHSAPLPTRGGRSRIQSSYFASGLYPRSSNAPFDAVNKSANSGPQHQTIPKSEPSTKKDTRALSDALGLSSPAPNLSMPSPQPTLYPDDSLSVVGVKQSAKLRQSYIKRTFDKDKDDPTSPVISTAMDASAAVGSLMLMNAKGNTAKVDFLPTKSMPIPKTALNKPMAKETGDVNSGSTLKRSMSRSDDKPPSIPLPAPLPSLAQMALEHASPQAYADYRSPTYSIYGLYGGDRKSGV